MLRSILILIGAVLALAGAVILVMGYAAGIGPLCGGALLLIGTVWERVRYKAIEKAAPGPGWVATHERFVDDKTGETVRVWIEPKSGERRYVAQ